MSDKIEIMAPVGSWESLSAAIQGGADSIYFGVQGLNMRSASSVNFTLEDLGIIVAHCKKASIRSYLTLNTVLYDDDLPYMYQVLDAARAGDITAVIVADQAAMIAARARGIEVHISTQLNISNIEAVAFYAQWADVMVLARELTLPQVSHIFTEIQRRNICGPSGKRIEIEMFAHGALCMAISGKCYLSLHEAWRSANRGECRQICRRTYKVEDLETGASLAVDNKYIMSPKDLCTIEFLDKMIAAGVRVLKIEGRARGAEYVRSVCECYKSAVALIEQGRYSAEAASGLQENLRRVFNRGFWGGYYLGHQQGRAFGEWTTSYGSSASRKKVYLGKVTNFFSKIGVAELLLEAADLRMGATLLFQGPTTGSVELECTEIRLPDGVVVDSVARGNVCSVKTSVAVRRSDKVYLWEA